MIQSSVCFTDLFVSQFNVNIVIIATFVYELSLILDNFFFPGLFIYGYKICVKNTTRKR